jgi:MFS family permease
LAETNKTTVAPHSQHGHNGSTGLWRHRGFLLLWGGQTISQFGSQITQWALPLTAVLLLKATPGQVGILAAAGSLPILLSLFAGVWIDRVRRRPLLIIADSGRALLLSTIPLAYWFGWLSMTQLYLVALFSGVLTILFDIAYRSFLPSLIAREQLVEGNSKLEAGRTLAGTAGPSLAGLLVQWFNGPAAILGDALSFVVSFLWLAFIRVREPVPNAGQRLDLRREIGEGLHTLVHHPLLRSLILASGIFNLFDSFLFAMYVPYLSRTLGAPPALIGLIMALGSAGGLLGALLAGRIPRAIGLGRTLFGSVLVAGVAELVIAMARGPLPIAALLVIIGEASVQVSASIYAINSLSLRQAIVPDRLQGRVNATARIIAEGGLPLGALLGGIIADHYGLRLSVLVAGCGTLFAFLVVLLSPVRSLSRPR